MKTGMLFTIFILVLAVLIITVGCTTSPGIQEEKEGVNQEVFFQSASIGNYAEVKKLIEAGADVNAQDKNGNTALTIASHFGHTEVAGLLIEKGADVNAQTNNGRTALIAASHFGHTEVAGLLIEKGADINAKTPGGFTALITALQEGHPEVARLLIEAGANVNAQSDVGGTALMLASGEGHLEVSKLLLKNRADVNVQGPAGYTALTFALEREHPEIAQLLIESGADLEVKNDLGATAVMVASDVGNLDIAKLLIESGTDVNAQSKEGFTALWFASKNGHTKAAQILKEAGAKSYVIIEDEQIPNGVTYIKTTDEINRKAYEYLLEIFYNTDSDIFLPKAITCGPFLWKELVEDMGYDETVGIPHRGTGTVLTENGVQGLEGRVIRWEDQTKKLQLALKAIFRESGSFIIRKLTPQEIETYWGIISYDIEEPVFIIESPGFLLLVDIAGDEVFFIDNFYKLFHK